MDKILKFDLSYFFKEKRGDVISKMIVDVKEIEISVIASLEMILKDPILIIVYLYVLFLINIKLTIIALLIFPVSALIIGRIGKSLKKATKRGQDKMGNLIGMLEETLIGIKIVKAFGVEEFVKNRFERLNQNYSKLFGTIWKNRAIANPINDIISTVSILIIMWVGGKMILNGEDVFTSQIFIGYLAVFTQVIRPAKAMTNSYYNIIRGITSKERIDTILSHVGGVNERNGSIKIKEFKRTIDFENVTFGYNGSAQPV